MATMKTISAALKLVDAKKENLRKAFEDLQAQSSSLSSFNLEWSDLDSYFASLQSSLEHKFKLLQSQPQPSDLPPTQPQPQPLSSSVTVKDVAESATVPARPQLKSFCKKMEGLRLRNYMVQRSKERTAVRAELPDALRCAPDAAAMVLDAMVGFYVPGSKGDKDAGLEAVRKSCVVLLEELMMLKVEIRAEVKEKAKLLASDWKGKVSLNGESPLEALGFLRLLATYGLGDGFDLEFLIDVAVIAARYRQATQLCRILAFGDRISDLILKLISKRKQLLAVKFIFEFELTDKFPPVPLLKDYVKESKKLAQETRNGGKSSLKLLNEATSKEVGALKSVIKMIEDYKLESEYPKDSLTKRIKMIEKKKAEKKRPPAAPASQTQKHSKPQKLREGKRCRIGSPAALLHSVAAASSTIPAFQQSHLQPAGLLPDVPPASYLSSPAGPYGLAGTTSASAPYAGSSGGLYGYAGASLDIHGNLMPIRPHVYHSESHTPAVYIDRPITYGGYGLPPQCHQPYHPH